MNAAKEELFTSDHLAQITAAATQYLREYGAQVVITGLASTSIQRVSTSTELILVQGNEHTGMQHIQVRHHPASLRRTWQTEITPNGETKVRLDDPSRFRPGIMPIFDYLDIADAIYSQGILDEEGNRRREEFEKYIGAYTYADGVQIHHTLLVYKDTKIIHSLFPKESFPKKKRVKGFLLRRGQATATWNPGAGITITTIPYLDREGVKRYSIIIYLNSRLKLQEIELVRHSLAGQPEQHMLMGSQSYEGHIEPSSVDELFRWQHADLTVYEQIISNTEKGLVT